VLEVLDIREFWAIVLFLVLLWLVVNR